jgi:hypothetical protein
MTDLKIQQQIRHSADNCYRIHHKLYQWYHDFEHMFEFQLKFSLYDQQDDSKWFHRF